MHIKLSGLSGKIGSNYKLIDVIDVSPPNRDGKNPDAPNVVARGHFQEATERATPSGIKVLETSLVSIKCLCPIEKGLFLCEIESGAFKTPEGNVLEWQRIVSAQKIDSTPAKAGDK